MGQSQDNPLRRQAWSVPALLRQQFSDLEPKVRQALSEQEIGSIQRIVLTGCGDSYAAAAATRHAFELLTDIPTEVVSALELARLYHERQLGFAPKNPLVVAISNSGKVARIVEAMMRAGNRGALTLAITGDVSSPLGASAQRILKLDIPQFEPAPGTRSYMVSVLTLLLLGIRVGEVRGKCPGLHAEEIRRDILSQGEELEGLLPDIDRQMLLTAEAWHECRAFDFAGAGFDYAAALYGRAKMLEATGRFAMHCDSEEWLHLNVFVRDTDATGTVLIANTTNPCHSRNKELAAHMGKVRPRMLIVSDGDRKDFAVDCHYVKVPKTVFPITMPLTQFVPLSLLAGYIQNLLGEEDARGCRGPWAFCADGSSVRDSQIIRDIGRQEALNGID